jgi:hypothetical protein
MILTWENRKESLGEKPTKSYMDWSEIEPRSPQWEAYNALPIILLLPSFFLGAFRKYFAKSGNWFHVQPSFRLSVRLSSWNDSSPTIRIFVKIDREICTEICGYSPDFGKIGHEYPTLSTKTCAHSYLRTFDTNVAAVFVVTMISSVGPLPVVSMIQW